MGQRYSSPTNMLKVLCVIRIMHIFVITCTGRRFPNIIMIIALHHVQEVYILTHIFSETFRRSTSIGTPSIKYSISKERISKEPRIYVLWYKVEPKNLHDMLVRFFGRTRQALSTGRLAGCSTKKDHTSTFVGWRGVTLAKLVKASVVQADVLRFKPHLGHSCLSCCVLLVKSRHFGLPLA